MKPRDDREDREGTWGKRESNEKVAKTAARKFNDAEKATAERSDLRGEIPTSQGDEV